jgi:hypothetical protein
MIINEGDRVLILNERNEGMEFYVGDARKPKAHSKPNDYGAFHLFPITENKGVNNIMHGSFVYPGVEFVEDE